MDTDYTNLDKLTDQLYAELISKSEKEIAEKKSAAVQEIEAREKQAQKEIDAYKIKADQEIAQERQKMESELRLKATAVLEDLQLALRTALNSRMIDAPLTELFSDKAFIKDYLFKLAEQLSASPLKLSLSLSADAHEQWQQQLNKHFPQLEIHLGAENQEIKILNSDEGFYLSLGEKELKTLFHSYLSQSLKDRL